ncbi:MAG: DegV family protein, partial [Oscillospiraceae bacterium]|nr:DegV family protein [Oscillospiraceae bacterium]
MRNVKIVADSSANVLQLHSTAFAAAPLKVITNEGEFVDDGALDLEEMVSWFASYKGKSKTSCPNSSDWLEAFGDADEVYCVTITSGLSGSYNAACAAKQLYESENPDKRVCVIDSLSAGPELVLIIEKLEEYIGQGLSYEEICRNIEAYKQQTGLVFMLESLKNFAANGRVSPAVAKIAGVLGIRIVGKASDQGTLEPTNKCRGEGKSLSAILSNLIAFGLHEGKVRIAHCMNEGAAQELERMILAQLPKVNVQIHMCRGLCCYYAEQGGLLVGFEKL